MSASAIYPQKYVAVAILTKIVCNIMHAPQTKWDGCDKSTAHIFPKRLLIHKGKSMRWSST